MILRLPYSILLALTILLAACTAPAPAARLYFYVSADGWYRVTGDELSSAGIKLSSTSPATFQLFHNEQELAIRVQGEGHDLKLDFYGQASDSPYSAFNVYALQWGIRSGKRIRDVTAPAPNGVPQDSFQATLRASQPTLYVPQAGDPDQSWFWQSLTAPATKTVTLDLTGALGGPAHVRVNLWGNTQDNANPDHHLRAFLNGIRIADETWDGQGARVLEGTVPVREGANSLQLVAPGDTKAIADVVLLRSVQVSYSHRLRARADALTFSATRGTVRIDGFTSDGIDIFDVTDPNEPTRIAQPVLADRAVTFASDSTVLRRWSAVGANGFLDVAHIVSAPATSLRARASGADYVVITYPGFAAALQPLVKWRADHGLKPFVATTSEIYAEFGYGAESPLALRAFLDALKPKPRFVLLVGKASYDYRDYLNAPNKSLLPAFLTDTPHLNQAASDNWFAAAGDADIHPTFAIGRIPAKSAEQVTRVVDKIIGYESSPRTEEWRQRALFIADDKESSFAGMADGLAAKLTPGIAAQKTYLADLNGDLGAARAEILARWNAGALAVTYVGHGSIDTWAEGPLFSATDLDAIKNGDRLPILFTPTCLDGFFYHPLKDSLAEQLLFQAGGGVVSAIAPTGLSVPEAQSDLMNRLFEELYSDRTPTLGEALLHAKQKMDASGEAGQEVIETFGLLGDPALTAGN